MLIFGSPRLSAQTGCPFPAIRFALVVPPDGAGGRAVLHSMGCPLLPPPKEDPRMPGADVVYSTTYTEIEDHAAGQFGEEGWDDCPVCVGMSDR